MNNAVILGYGTVGKATAHAFGIKNYYDIKKGSTLTLKEAARLRYHFVCLPTPVSNGRYYLDDITHLVRQIIDYRGGQNVFIIRSTILPGTCRALVEATGTEAIVHVPEFLSETTWKKDAEQPELAVVGCDRHNYRADVAGIFKARYKGTDVISTDSVTAELVKCARNAFYSTKVVFANEIYEIAQKTGANYEVVKDALYKSKWIGKNHLAVHYKRPDWKKAKRGLHGKCLQKDLEALAEFGNSSLLKEVIKLNEKHKSKES